MKIIKPSAEILYPATQEDINGIYKRIEIAGRTCYDSESQITDGSANKLITSLISRGHESVIEHGSMTVRFIIDRGVSHEMVRHRLASYSQQSTRYCNYSKEKYGNELTFIEPCFWDHTSANYMRWKCMMRTAEVCYLSILEHGGTPEQARSVLPNSLMTKLVMTADLREWRTIFKQRAAGLTGKPHPQMEEVMVKLLAECQQLMPEIFGDIKVNGNA